MAKQDLSLKRIAIDKDNTTIVVAVGLAVFLVIFSIMASNALIKQMSYQSGVISKKKDALKTLKKNEQEVDKLKTSYQAFADSQQNVLSGSATGTGDKDGDNPRIILDALPSKYDFPALATSLEKVFKPYGIESITGTDDEVTQASAAASEAPQAVEIPFTVTVNSSPQNIKQLLETFEKSIRPMNVKKVKMSGETNSIKVTIDSKTYFQPQKKFDIKKEAAK